MLLGQYWVGARNVSNRKACWRRGKKIERFRSKPQEICEMLMLDDANLAEVDIEDWKAWFDLTEGGSGDGRYSDAKYCTNAPRAMLTNEVNFSDEPCLLESVAPVDFWNMVRSTFGYMKDVHRFAIFKRCITLIGSRRRLLLRLPSEDPEAPAAIFTDDDVAADWLQESNKPYLSQYQEGTHAKYPDYDVHAAEQAEWARELINGPKRKILEHAPSRPESTLWSAVPDTQASAAEEETMRAPIGPDGAHQLPAVPHFGRGSSVRGRFRIPGDQAPTASSSSLAPPVSVKREPLTDSELAAIYARHEQMAMEGPMVIEDSPRKKSRQE